MKIDDGNQLPQPRIPQRKERPDAQPSPSIAHPGAGGIAPTGQDSSGLSPTAQLAQQALGAGGDEARIERLRAAVQSGSYRLSADDLANSLIDAHTEFQ
jgi:flagellar biosynthesis anti-sigma factor FlgM